MNIKLDIHGAEGFINRLQGITDRANNLRSVFSEIADDFNRVERQAFGGSPDLIRTGAVRDALTSAEDDGSVREIDLDAMVVGTDIWYAKFHRDELLKPISVTVQNDWIDMIGDFILRGRFGAGVL
jgi:hypothetical protein